MVHSDSLFRLRQLWSELYNTQGIEDLEQLLEYLNTLKDQNAILPHENGWHKNAVVYSLYVDLFNNTFEGLTGRLDYLNALGIDCLWLLPVFESPMRDMGFDISDFYRLRQELFATGGEISDNRLSGEFQNFLKEAHKRDIKVIFDIALNHVSTRHKWFIQAVENSQSEYRNYFIWSDNEQKYADAPVIFSHLNSSNWSKAGNQFYFHRFFEFQADLNYQNPAVLAQMSHILAFWVSRGIDGFRADAIPFIWKQEGTRCENLPQTHTIIAFFRAVLDYIKPGTLFLAEACMPQYETLKYFGNENQPECNAAYHFEMVIRFFEALAKKNKTPLVNCINQIYSTPLPFDSQWFVFLRCHDELNFEMVENYQWLHSYYCHDRRWNFRNGAGISARLADLLDYNPAKIGLAFSLLLSTIGTPIIFYGDEYAKLNDIEYYYRMSNFTGVADTRYLARGKVDWRKVFTDIDDKRSLANHVYNQIRKMTSARKKIGDFGLGKFTEIPIKTYDGAELYEVFAFKKDFKYTSVLFIHNLADKPVQFQMPLFVSASNDLMGQIITDTLKPFQYYWIQL